MNILEIAKEQFGTVLVHGKEYFELDEEGLQAFAVAVIGEYKASLEPVGWQFLYEGKWIDGLSINQHEQNTKYAGYETRNIYALPLGEPK